MACPYFVPGKPDPAGEASARPRPPLGRFHDGSCMSGMGESPLPLERCNLGYARGLACFPAECEADASRFSIAKDDGEAITVQWCIERDHRPLSWGTANWNCGSGGFEESIDDPVFSSQMAAYAASYLAAREPSSSG